MAGLATRVQVVTWPDCPVTEYGPLDVMTTSDAAATAAALFWDGEAGRFVQPQAPNGSGGATAQTVTVRVWDEDGDARDWTVSICVDFLAVPASAEAVPR